MSKGTRGMVRAAVIQTLLVAGFTRQSVVAAVAANDISLLECKG